MIVHVFRLTPGNDLRKEIAKFAKTEKILAGIILTCVGSLKKAVLRLADDKVIKTFEGPFEIVSLVGTLEYDDLHLHISLGDKNGKVVGGHLKEGCVVHTTAEIAIGEMRKYAFKRRPDPQTGFAELDISVCDNTETA